jgi:acyl carrier protein
MPIDWARFGARFGRAPLHRDVIAEAEPAVRATPAIVETLRALPPAQRRGALAEHVNARMAKVMGLTTAIDPTARLGDLGVDSLMAVELRNALSASLGRPLRSTLLFDFPTIDELTDHVGADVLDLWPGQPAPAAEQAHAEIESELDALDDDELNDIIDRELHVWQSRRPA